MREALSVFWPFAMVFLAFIVTSPDTANIDYRRLSVISPLGGVSFALNSILGMSRNVSGQTQSVSEYGDAVLGLVMIAVVSLALGLMASIYLRKTTRNWFENTLLITALLFPLGSSLIIQSGSSLI